MLSLGLKEELKPRWLGYSLGCSSEGGGKGLNLKKVKSVAKKVGSTCAETRFQNIEDRNASEASHISSKVIGNFHCIREISIQYNF